MNNLSIRLPAVALALTAPMAAYAQNPPHQFLLISSGIGGLVGGFVGALLACWLCNRRKRNDDDGSKKY